MAACDCVEYACVEIVEEMKLPLNSHAESTTPSFCEVENETQNFTVLQDYKDGIGAGHTGIDMEYAWSVGITGKGIKIADIEYGIHSAHMNFSTKKPVLHFQ